MSGVEGVEWSTETRARYAARRERWRVEAVALGQEMRGWRRMAGMNQYELAPLVGTTQGEVSALELGLRARGQTVRFLARIEAVCAHVVSAWPDPSCGPVPQAGASDDGRHDGRRDPVVSLVWADAAG